MREEREGGEDEEDDGEGEEEEAQHQEEEVTRRRSPRGRDHLAPGRQTQRVVEEEQLLLPLLPLSLPRRPAWLSLLLLRPIKRRPPPQGRRQTWGGRETRPQSGYTQPGAHHCHSSQSTWST